MDGIGSATALLVEGEPISLKEVLAGAGLARELLLQITEEGADFHAAARRFSCDPDTRKLGGYAGWARRGSLPPAERAAAFAAAPGAPIGPFRTREGWLLYMVEDR